MHIKITLCAHNFNNFIILSIHWEKFLQRHWNNSLLPGLGVNTENSWTLGKENPVNRVVGSKGKVFSTGIKFHSHCAGFKGVQKGRLLKWVFLFVQLSYSCNSIICAAASSVEISHGPIAPQGGALATGSGTEMSSAFNKTGAPAADQEAWGAQYLTCWTGWSLRVTAHGRAIKHSEQVVYFKGTRDTNLEGERRYPGIKCRDWVTRSCRVSRPLRLPGRGGVLCGGLAACKWKGTAFMGTSENADRTTVAPQALFSDWS